MSKVAPIDQEYVFEHNVIISQTDTQGIITYANRAFCQVSGYTKNELIGKSQNIVRHPDMPKKVFKKMWETIQSGQTWHGFIKNLRKDGRYYWVSTEILPIRDNANEITGYIAVRKIASKKDIEENEAIYNSILATQD